MRGLFRGIAYVVGSKATGHGSDHEFTGYGAQCSAVSALVWVLTRKTKATDIIDVDDTFDEVDIKPMWMAGDDDISDRDRLVGAHQDLVVGPE